MKPIVMLLSILLPILVCPCQAQKTIRKGGMTITMSSDHQAEFAEHLVKVADVVKEGFDQLGVKMPQGIHLKLLEMEGFRSEQRTHGLDPDLVKEPVFAAYDYRSDWTPTVFVLAEQSMDRESSDYKAKHVACALGGLVGLTMSKSPVPPLTQHGHAGLGAAFYKVSALRNQGATVSYPGLPRVQLIIEHIVGLESRVTPREMLGKLPSDSMVREQHQLFLNVLLHDAPVAKRAAVLKTVRSWSRDAGVELGERHIARMEKSLVDALGLKGPALKPLEAKMEELGIEQARRRDPGSLLHAHYEIELLRLHQACQAIIKAAEGAPDKARF